LRQTAGLGQDTDVIPVTEIATTGVWVGQMRTHSLILALPICALAVAGASGCGAELTPKTKLRDARILAVRAEPVNPEPGEVSTFTPLLYMPEGETATYQWSWCPFPTDSTAGYPCPIDQAGLDQLAQAAGLLAVPPLDLGTAATVSFANPFPIALTTAMCGNDPATLARVFGALGAKAANIGLISCGLATFPVQIKLTITTAKSSDAGVFNLNLPIDETTPRNQNPVVRGLWDATTPPGVPLDDLGTVVRPTGSDVTLRVDMDESSSEAYLDKITLPDGEFQRDVSGNLVLGPARERITVSWFKEFGGLDKDSSGYNAKALYADGTPIPFEVALKNTWTAPLKTDNPPPTVKLMAVVRDGRGGVGWTSGVVGLEAGK